MRAEHAYRSHGRHHQPAQFGTSRSAVPGPDATHIDSRHEHRVIGHPGIILRPTLIDMEVIPRRGGRESVALLPSTFALVSSLDSLYLMPVWRD